MSKQPGEGEIDSGMAEAFLKAQFDRAFDGIELAGEGAWSRAFAFRRGDEELVARFGRHGDDFRKDQRAFAYRGPALPIPEVLAIGPAFDGYFAVSSRVYGNVLELLEAPAWRTVVPSLVDALEALRLADVEGSPGYGEWDGSGHAPFRSWREYLLAVAEDPPDRRTHGWREQLASHAAGADAFQWGFELLRQTASDAVPRSLIHGDLMNRNVLVEGGRISGVFDWGCAAYGDHLYDLAWFEFWADWYPQLDVPLLRSALEERWLASGYEPPNLAARLRACHLHIGLAHLAYNAYQRDWAAITATAERMHELVGAEPRES